MKPIELRNEELKNSITGYLAALEALVRQRDALKLYDVNQHCEEIYGELLNEVLKRRHLRLKLISANTPEHPNLKGIDLIDEKRRVVVQITSSATNDKLNHTFHEINDQRGYNGFTLYFMFIAGKMEKLDLRKNRHPKFITCKREHLLYPEDLTKLLQGCTSRSTRASYEKVLKILKYHLGDDDQKTSPEQCLGFINKIAGLVKAVDHVRCMCEELLQSRQGMKGFGSTLLHRINHQVCNHIPDSLPALEPIRHACAKNMPIYSSLLEIGRLVFEIDCTAKDDIRYLDIHEVKKLAEALLREIYPLIRYMCKTSAIREEITFTELSIKAHEY